MGHIGIGGSYYKVFGGCGLTPSWRTKPIGAATPINAVWLLGPLTAAPLQRALDKWCNAHNLTKIRHVYVKTTDPEIAFMVPEEDIADDLLKQPWLQDKGRAIMNGSCRHRCYVMAAWVPGGPRIDLKDITYCTLEASTVFAAEDSRLDDITDSQVVQLFTQNLYSPGLNVPRAFLMQRGTDGQPTKEASIISNDKGVVAAAWTRQGAFYYTGYSKQSTDGKPTADMTDMPTKSLMTEGTTCRLLICGPWALCRARQCESLID